MQAQYGLSNTTLGDVLGQLYRSRACALVELRESSSGSLRRHRLYLYNGLVCGIESPLTKKPLTLFLEKRGLLTDEAKALVQERGLSADANGTRLLLLANNLVQPSEMRATVQFYTRKFIDKLCSFEDGTVNVLPIRRMSNTALRTGPMPAEDFLHGRPRSRDRFAELGEAGAMAYNHMVIAKAFAALGHASDVLFAVN